MAITFLSQKNEPETVIKDFNKKLWIIKTVVFCLLCFTSIGKADLLKCAIKKFPEITNYFDSGDAKERKKCLTKPVAH